MFRLDQLRGQGANNSALEASSDSGSDLDLDLYDTDSNPDDVALGALSLSELTSLYLEDDDHFEPISGASAAATSTDTESATEARSTATTTPLHPSQYTSNPGSSASSRNRRYPQRPAPPISHVRTNFTTATVDAHRTPKDDYVMLCTPPGEPPETAPSDVEASAAVLAAAAMTTTATQEELYLRRNWVYGLVCVGIGLGVAVQSQNPPDDLTYWVVILGDLYVRLTTCIALPLAFFQVIAASAELANLDLLARAWHAMLLLIVVCTLASVSLALAIALAFRPLFSTDVELNLSLPYTPFAIKCPSGEFLEQHTNGSMLCTGQGLGENTTFARLVDVDQRLGMTAPVGQVDISGYLLALLDVYFPKNLAAALSESHYQSCMIIATVLGLAVAQSFSTARGGLARSRSPLFRLATHTSLALLHMHRWVQRALALVSIIPITAGAILAIPNLATTLHLTRYYVCALVLGSAVKCLVIAPALFFLVTHENPYAWLREMLTPVGYAFVLHNDFTALGVTRDVVVRSGRVPPPVFNAMYPLLCVIDRSTVAMGFPLGLFYTAAFSGCGLHMDAGNVAKLIAFSTVSGLGRTTLPDPLLTVFLTTWRSFCSNEDTPPAVVLLASVPIVIHYLGAMVSSITHVLMIRMVAHMIEPKSKQK